MKIQKRIEITKRGYALLNKYVPGLVRAKTIAAVLETLSPFVTVWFSARIINELMNDRRQNVLILYVILVIGIHLLFSMIKDIMDKIVNDKESGMWNYFNKIFSDKQMSMDYAILENKDIQKMRQKAEENLFMFGNGLGQLIWDTTSLVKVIVGIVASISSLLGQAYYYCRTNSPVHGIILFLLYTAHHIHPHTSYLLNIG